MDMRKGNVSKKRKLGHVVAENNHDDYEEQKIEEFYALIRNMREARDRLIKGPTSSDDQAMRTDHHLLLRPHNMKPNNSQSWKPSFVPEDFITSNADGQETLASNFKVPKTKQSSLTTTCLGTSSSSSIAAKIFSHAAAAPDHHDNHHQNQVGHTNNVSSKEPLDLSLSL